MSNELSRRDFLRIAASATVAGVAGCAGQSTPAEAPPAPPAGAPAAPVAGATATQQADGSVRVAGGGKLGARESLAFSFPGGATPQPGIVFATADGQLGALSASCTHAGCTVVYEKGVSKDDLHCPCHDSHFDTSGAVLKGPARTPLTRYTVKKDGDDAILTKA